MIYCIHRVYKEIGHNIVVNVDWSHIALSIRMRHSVGHILSIVLKISSRKCFNAHMFICTRYTAVVVVYYMTLSPEILLQKNVTVAVIHLSNVNHKCNVIRLKITRKNPQKASYCLSTCFHCLYHMQAYYLHVVFII